MPMTLKAKKTKTFRSLRVTLAIAFLALSAVVLLIASSLNMYFSFQTQQELITNEQRFIAQNAADTVRSFVQEKLSELKATVRLGNLVGIRQEERKIVLEQLLGFDPAFRQLVLLNAQNQELAKVSRLSNLVSYGFIKRIGSDLFSQVSQGEIYIGSVYIDEITSEPMVIMTVPVTDVFGDFKGVLMAEVNLKFMWDLVGRIKVGNKGLAYVVDEKGNLIASGDISRVLKGENLIYLHEVNEFVKGDILTHKESANVVKGIQGNQVVANHAHLGTPNWAVVVELPVLEVYKTVITTLIASGLIILLSFALAIIFGIFLSKRIAKPIISLRDAAIKIGEGRLDTQIEIEKNDEIGDLAAAFNQMTEDLQKTTTSIDNLNREITERKRVEEVLRKTEEKYRMQFEGALDAIFVGDAETGIIIDCNTAATRLVGREKSELVGKHQRILHPPESIEGEFSKTFKQHLSEEQGQVLETQIISKTGEIRDVAIKANLLEIRGKKLLQGIFRDITEHKKAEQALRESEQRLSIILNSILTAVVLIDAETHQIIDPNPLATELIGLPKEEIAGKLCHRFICPAEQGKCPISDLGQTVDQSERVLIRGDGKEVPILKTVIPISWQGHSYFVESFVDITERKKAEQRQAELLEQLEKTNQELKDFAYIVSHDLKAPLRGINTLVNWISTDYADKLDEDGKEQMNLLTNRVNRMHSLIDGILHYSRVGRIKEKKVMVNLNELVTEVIDMISPPENISIAVENELPTIECEQTPIMQIFQNLLSNSIKYMNKPKGQIKVGCVEENGFWKFNVADNGAGIEEKYFEKIFQMFQTLSSRDEFESTGVGLTVTKKIVEMYGGKIWVQSKVDEGSTFFFTLPKALSVTNSEKQLLASSR